MLHPIWPTSAFLRSCTFTRPSSAGGAHCIGRGCPSFTTFNADVSSRIQDVDKGGVRPSVSSSTSTLFLAHAAAALPYHRQCRGSSKMITSLVKCDRRLSSVVSLVCEVGRCCALLSLSLLSSFDSGVGHERLTVAWWYLFLGDVLPCSSQNI